MTTRDKRIIKDIGETVEPIEINIYTNIPGKEKTPIPFTRKLYHDKVNTSGIKLQDYPFFTPDYRIDESIITEDFDDKVKHLFNRNEFVKITDSSSDFGDIEPPDKRGDINIQTLLTALFPTYYPVLLNQTNTFSEMIENKLPTQKYVSSFLAYFGNLFKARERTPGKPDVEFTDVEKAPPPVNHPFCYLDIDGSTYTVLKVVHLNDFMNNPKYFEIFKKFLDIKKWKENQTNTNETKIYKYKLDIVEAMDRLIYEMNILNNRFNFFNNLRVREDKYKINNEPLLENIRKQTNKLFYEPYDIDISTINENLKKDTTEINNLIYIKPPPAGTNTPPTGTDTPTAKPILDEIDEWVKTDSSNNTIFKTNFNILQKYQEKTGDDKSKEYDLSLSQTSRIYQDVSRALFKIQKDTSNNNITYVVKNTLKNLLEIRLKSFKLNNNEDIKAMVPINRKTEKFEKLKDDEKTVYTKYKTAIDAKYDKYADYIEFINPLFKGESSRTSSSSSSSGSIVFDGKFSKLYEDIFITYKKLMMEIKIQEVYFGDDRNITKEIDEEVTKYFNSKHTKYNEFIQFINKFIQPNREASNPYIVNMILNYIRGEESKVPEETPTTKRDEINGNLEKFLERIKKEDISDIKDFLRLSYEKHHTRVVNAPVYEIQVYMDLIKGKLTKDDITNLGCYFKDKELVSTFNNIVYKNVFDNIFIFDDKLPVLPIPKRRDLKAAILPQPPGRTAKTVQEAYKPSSTAPPAAAKGGYKKKVIKSRRKNRYFNFPRNSYGRFQENKRNPTSLRSSGFFNRKTKKVRR